VAEIDVAPLEELIEIGREQAKLEGFRHRAEELRASVNSAVFDRVIADYMARREALERQAAPIKAQVRRAYLKLRDTLGRAHATEEEARLAAEELEFRHAVGELDDAELAERRQEPDRVVERCRQQLATLDALKAHFLEAFGAESELEGDPRLLSRTATTEGTAESSDTTNIFSARTIDASDDTVPTSSASTNEAPADNAVGTLRVPPALLDPEDGTAPHPLALSNYIGRSEENHIRLDQGSVSRQHALVAATSGAFVIQDLHSQNGTFVNGDRITRHTLHDGDRVKVGDVAFVFRVSRSAA
jgi:hypothetical protein